MTTIARAPRLGCAQITSPALRATATSGGTSAISLNSSGSPRSVLSAIAARPSK